jgi:hypothetical protein
MEILFDGKNNRFINDKLKNIIIDEYVNTEVLKKDLMEKHNITASTLNKILKDSTKLYCSCLICGQNDINKFKKDNKKKCKDCINKDSSVRYQKLSDIDKKKYLIRQHKWVKNNIIKCRILSAKHRAKKKDLEFDIDEDFINNLLIEQNYKCKYSGNILDTSSVGSQDTKMNIYGLSIDRIDSKKGYTKDNVVLVASIVNTMKNELTETDFLAFIKTLYDYNFKND